MVLAAILLIISAALLFFHIAGPAIGSRLLARALPWPSAAVEIGDWDLHGLHAFTLNGIRITPGPGREVLTVDTATVRFSLRQVLRSPRRITSVRLAGLRLEAAFGDSGTAWLAPFRPSLSADSANSARGEIQIDQLVIDRGRILAMDGSGNSVLEMDSLTTTAGILRLGSTNGVDDVAAAFRVTQRDTSSRLRVTARLGVVDQVARVDSLVVTDSAGGRLLVSGRVRPGDSTAKAVDLQVTGSGLHPALVHPALASLVAPAQRADLEATVTGSADRPSVRSRIDLGHAGRIHLDTDLLLQADSVHLTAHTVLNDLDVSRLSGKAAGMPLNGTVDARLNVTQPDALDGPVTLDLYAGAGRRPLHVTGRADFAGGIATVKLDAAGEHLVSRVRGWVRPLGPTLGIDLEASARISIRVPGWAERRIPEWRGPWNTTVRLVASGPTVDQMSGTLHGRITNPGTASPGEGAFDGTVRDGVVSMRGQFRMEAMDLDGAGTADVADPVSSWEVTRLRLRRVPLRPWLGGADAGQAYVSVTARAVDGGAAARVTVDSVRGGRAAGVTADLRASRRRERGSMTGLVQQGAGLVRVDRFETVGTALRHVTLTFRGLDPGAIDSGLPAGALSGRLVLDPLPGPAAALPAAFGQSRLAGRLTLEESRLGGAPVSGEVQLDLRDGILSADATLESDAQRLAFRGSTPLSQRLAVRLDRAEFRGFDPSRWSGGSLPAGRMDGTAHGMLTIADSVRAVGEFGVVIDSAQVGVLRVQQANLRLRLREGRAHLSGDANASGEHVTFEAEGVMTPRGAWEGDGTLVVRDLLQRETGDSLLLRLGLRAPDAPRATGWRLGMHGHGALRSVRLDSLEAEVELRERTLMMTRLAGAGPGLEFSGVGHLPIDRTLNRQADVAVDGVAKDASGLLHLAGVPGRGGRGTLSLRVSGPTADLRQDLTLQVADVRAAGLQLDTIDVRILGRSDSANWLASAAATISSSTRGPLLVAPAGTSLRVGPGSPASEEGGTVRLSAEWASADPRMVRVPDLATLIDGIEWRLDRPTTIRWGPALEVGETRLHSTTGEVVLRGRLDPDGEQDFQLDVSGLPVQARAEGASGLGGVLGLRLRVLGPAADPGVALEGEIRPVDGSPPAMTLHLDAAANQMDLRYAVTKATGRLEVSGTIPVRFRIARSPPWVGLTEEQVALEVRASRFDLGAVGPLLPPRNVGDLLGDLTGTVRVTGSTSNPRFDGRLVLSDFAARAGPYATVLASKSIAIDLAGTRATVTEGVFETAPQGTMRLSGGVEFPDLRTGRLDLLVSMDRFHGAQSGQLDATVSGAVTVRGTLRAPQVAGRIDLEEVNYRIPALDLPTDLERVELTDADYEELERRFGVQRAGSRSREGTLWDATVVDLSVSAVSNVWARHLYAPAIAVEVAGTLDVDKAAGGPLRLDGALNVVEGRSFVEEFGRRFAVERGTARFSGELESVELDGEATYRPDDDVTIRLHMTGGHDGFALTLGSEPSMDETDIVSYIAVGRPATSVMSGEQGSEDLTGLGANIALSRVSAGVQDLAREALGLNVVELRQDGFRGLTLVAGRYVTRRFYLGFQQPVSFTSHQDGQPDAAGTAVDAEYRMAGWLLANLTGARSMARFFLRARHEY